MIDRYLLRYFLAVIDQGNFSKAAAACNVSQPTLSVGIAKLEQTLDRALFLRTNRRVELTEAGVRLASHARRIEASFSQAEREVRGARALTTLRLGVLVTTPAAWIEDFLQSQVLADDGQRVEIVEARERDLLDRLTRGRIDAAFTIVRPDGARFDSEILLTEGYGLALAASHRLAGRQRISAEELADEPMIVRRQCELLSDTSRYFTARGVRPFFCARTFDDSRALAYVRSGAGLTVMPDGFTAPGVARVQLEDFEFTRDLGVLYAPHTDRAELTETAAMRLLTQTVIAAGRPRQPVASEK